MACGIYCILNLLDGKIYIGSSDDIAARFRQHLYCLKHNKHHSRHLQFAWNKYGPNNFIFFMLEETSIKNLNKIEQYYIDKYNSCNDKFGYNILVQAGSSRGHKRSLETIEKSRLGHLGQRAWNKDIWKRKVSEKQLVDFYKKGNSVRDCQEEFDISEETISMILKRNGVMRTKIESVSLPKARKRNSESKIGCVAWNKGMKGQYSTSKKDNWKKKISLHDIALYYKNGATIIECCKKFNICETIMSIILNENNLIRSSSKSRLLRKNKTLVEA